MSDEVRPRVKRTFEEVKGGTSGHGRCKRCRQEEATVSAVLNVSRLGTKGQQIARAKGVLCESCAVDIYEAVAKAVAA